MAHLHAHLSLFFLGRSLIRHVSELVELDEVSLTEKLAGLSPPEQTVLYECLWPDPRKRITLDRLPNHTFFDRMDTGPFALGLRNRPDLQTADLAQIPTFTAEDGKKTITPAPTLSETDPY